MDVDVDVVGARLGGDEGIIYVIVVVVVLLKLYMKGI